jgi:hypothetical protein
MSDREPWTAEGWTKSCPPDQKPAWQGTNRLQQVDAIVRQLGDANDTIRRDAQFAVEVIRSNLRANQ